MSVMCDDCKCTLYLEDKPDGSRDFGGCENGCPCCNQVPSSLVFARDNAPTYCEATADLYLWASNYDDFKPFAKFLDLIGYTDEPLSSWTDPTDGLGYLELSKLAGALEEYANRPEDVKSWLASLLEIEEERGL